eukprot:1604083-Prymnesium_polylepis.1
MTPNVVSVRNSQTWTPTRLSAREAASSDEDAREQAFATGRTYHRLWCRRQPSFNRGATCS